MAKLPILTAAIVLGLGLLQAPGLATGATIPTQALPAQFGGVPAVVAPTPAADAAFWQALGDPALDALVADALRDNLDLHQAAARLAEARALARGSRAEQAPGLRLGARASDDRASAAQAPGLDRAARDTESRGVFAVVDWELDLFGRLRQQARAGRAEAEARSADLAALQVGVVADLVETYVALRGSQQRLAVARANLQAQEDTRGLVERGLAAGRGTDFDAARVRAQAQRTAARLPPLEGEVRILAHRLAVLTGRPPEALITQLQAEAGLPAMPAAIDPGTPGDLLRRRPDVAAAERRVQAALALERSARADLFPRFSLAALIGSQAGAVGDLFQRDAEHRSFAFGVDWSFLDRARVRSRIAAADARADAATAAYRQAVLAAMEDTANALERQARAREEDERLAGAMRDSAEAARLARSRHDAGVGTLLEVLDAERGRLEAEDAAVQARVRSLAGAVDVYRAVAGGWPTARPGEVAAR